MEQISGDNRQDSGSWIYGEMGMGLGWRNEIGSRSSRIVLADYMEAL